MALSDIRKSRAFSPEQVAERLGGKQVYVYRHESRSDVKVSTLRDYVNALGGELQVMVTFPEGAKTKIRGASSPHSPVSLPSTKSTVSRPR
jgi:hypothetical protein